MSVRGIIQATALIIAGLALGIAILLERQSPKVSILGRLWQRIRETYASLAGGPDWGSWIMHASIGALLGYFHQPVCATLFYGLRELEQGTLKDDWRARWLDHLMDWVAPTAAAFAMAKWGR